MVPEAFQKKLEPMGVYYVKNTIVHAIHVETGNYLIKVFTINFGM